MNRGFTLIEMSIVLVIIGLIIGAVLVGEELISAAAVRAQVSQIEKYNQAVNTFKGKYGYLPGDLPDPYATQFGFDQAEGVGTRGAAEYGDGNGLIEAPCFGPPCGARPEAGEGELFWDDLSVAGLLDTTIKIAANSGGWAGNVITTANLSKWFPAARMGQNNYVYAWSGGWAADSMSRGSSGRDNLDNTNYYGVSAVLCGEAGCPGGVDGLQSLPGMTVMQAYNIDKKMDDGFPQTGRVVALYLATQGDFGGNVCWAGIVNCPIPAGQHIPATASATTCFDSSTGQVAYSVGSAFAATQNCALSFMFQ